MENLIALSDMVTLWIKRECWSQSIMNDSASMLDSHWLCFVLPTLLTIGCQFGGLLRIKKNMGAEERCSY